MSAGVVGSSPDRYRAAHGAVSVRKQYQTSSLSSLCLVPASLADEPALGRTGPSQIEVPRSGGRGAQWSAAADSGRPGFRTVRRSSCPKDWLCVDVLSRSQS